MARYEWRRAKRPGTAATSATRRAAGAVLPVVAAALIGEQATLPSLAPWSASLAKPAFNPPNAIFGPVWSALYGLMAYAAWRILKFAAPSPERRAALAFFLGQLALNAAWSWLFFGLQRPLLGLLDILPQWLLILATVDRFRRLDRIAGLCVVPLAAWVAFAGLLNYEIWRLNP